MDDWEPLASYNCVNEPGPLSSIAAVDEPLVTWSAVGETMPR